jgi:hypothetical protein
VELEVTRQLRILDFDIECRPIAWYGGDFVTKQPTGIAWKFIGEKEKTQVMVIGESFDTRQVLDEERAMLDAFHEAYDKADMVTGHYIRGYDLPTLQSALLRLKMRLLGDKLVQDTKVDLLKASGISKSQENLGAMFELDHPKFPMDTTKWGYANMLLPDGVKLTRMRVVSDVDQHIELRQEMLDLGSLAPPVNWERGGRKQILYTP